MIICERVMRTQSDREIFSPALGYSYMLTKWYQEIFRGLRERGEGNREKLSKSPLGFVL